MDCVTCEKCRLWGKLQVLGFGTALKILFDDGDTEGDSVGDPVGDAVGAAVGAAQAKTAGHVSTCGTHRRLTQSLPLAQFFPGPQGLHPHAPCPPQSTSVSTPFCVPSAHALLGLALGLELGLALGLALGEADGALGSSYSLPSPELYNAATSTAVNPCPFQIPTSSNRPLKL